MSGATHSSRCASRPVRLASAGDDIGSRTLSWLLVVMRAEVSETADPHNDTFVWVTFVTNDPPNSRGQPHPQDLPARSGRTGHRIRRAPRVLGHPLEARRGR